MLNVTFNSSFSLRQTYNLLQILLLLQTQSANSLLAEMEIQKTYYKQFKEMILKNLKITFQMVQFKRLRVQC